MVAHLFTQLGAECAPKVMVQTPEWREMRFGWHTPAVGGEYTEFLHAFLPALKAELDGLVGLDHVWFHISDEPHDHEKETYAAAKATVLEAYQSARTEGYNAGAEFDDWRVEYLAEDWSQTYSGGTLVAYNMNYEYHAGTPAAIMLAGGGSGELTTSATVLVYYIYQKAFIDWDLGYSSSVAMVLFLMVLFVTIIQFRGQAKREKA